jgi:hypothetical protein
MSASKLTSYSDCDHKERIKCPEDYPSKQTYVPGYFCDNCHYRVVLDGDKWTSLVCMTCLLKPHDADLRKCTGKCVECDLKVNFAKFLTEIEQKGEISEDIEYYMKNHGFERQLEVLKTKAEQVKTTNKS